MAEDAMAGRSSSTRLGLAAVLAQPRQSRASPGRSTRARPGLETPWPENQLTGARWTGRSWSASTWLGRPHWSWGARHRSWYGGENSPELDSSAWSKPPDHVRARGG